MTDPIYAKKWVHTEVKRCLKLTFVWPSKTYSDTTKLFKLMMQWMENVYIKWTLYRTFKAGSLNVKLNQGWCGMENNSLQIFFVMSWKVCLLLLDSFSTDNEGNENIYKKVWTRWILVIWWWLNQKESLTNYIYLRLIHWNSLFLYVVMFKYKSNAAL